MYVLYTQTDLMSNYETMTASKNIEIIIRVIQSSRSQSSIIQLRNVQAFAALRAHQLPRRRR